MIIEFIVNMFIGVLYDIFFCIGFGIMLDWNGCYKFMVGVRIGVGVLNIFFFEGLDFCCGF